MYARFLTFILATAVAFVFVPASHAQAANVDQMLARMQAIMLQMEELQSEFSTLAKELQGTASSGAVLGASTSATPVFTESLAYGETNDDIARIQRLLATDPEIYPYGVASGFFGPKTQEAIRNLQTRFGLDPVGVIGPATTALLEGYMRAYPNESYPDGVLSTKPRVLGVATSQPQTPTTPTSPVVTNTQSGTNPARFIEVEFDEEEAWIEIDFRSSSDKILVADTEDEDEVIEYIVDKTVLTESQVREVIEFEDAKRDNDADEDDAEDAIEDAEDAIDDAEEEIDEADEDGDDVDWALDTLDEAEEALEDAEDALEDEEYDDAVEYAEEAEELAEKAENRIDEEKPRNDADDIDEIKAIISDGEAEIEIEYEDGDDESFTVNDDDEDDIIEEVADELDIDEEDVEDLIEFEYDFGDLDEVLVEIDEDEEESYVEVWFEDGTEKSFTIDETDEDDIIEEIADRYDLDEDDIEDVIEFDDV